MRRSILVFLVLCGCGTSSVAPGGEFDDDTGSSTSDTSTTTTDTGGTVVTDSDTTMMDGTTPPPTDGSTTGCTPLMSGTQAVHVTMSVTWPGTVGTEAGSGMVHVWTRSKFTVDASNKITAVNSPCGSQVPEITKTPVAGGGKVLVEFPASVWNSASMPTFNATGTQTGFEVGSKVSMTATAAIVGTTMADPNAAWPAVGSIVAADHDGDTKPGITGVPRNGGGFTLPPTSLLRTNSADKLYLATRTTSALEGTRDTCTSQKGTATISHFDNHVIGCHVAGGGECSKSESDFIDNNRTVYTVKSATYETKVIPDGSNCDAVRAALPAK